jgi:hypothetical protein
MAALKKAEREAVWKDVAFTAVHKLGNPIFALETNLQVMKNKIEAHPDEALEIAREMAVSIEKAKAIIEQFKSLTRAQEISARPVDLVPLIESASRVQANPHSFAKTPGGYLCETSAVSASPPYHLPSIGIGSLSIFSGGSGLAVLPSSGASRLASGRCIRRL